MKTNNKTINKIYCQCCGRQIVQGKTSNDYVAPSPPTFLWSDKYCCAECSKDLDENGLFPEERQ